MLCRLSCHFEKKYFVKFSLKTANVLQDVFSAKSHNPGKNNPGFEFFRCGFFKVFSVFNGLSGSTFLSCLQACNATLLDLLSIQGRIYVVRQEMRSSAAPLCLKISCQILIEMVFCIKYLWNLSKNICDKL